MTLMIPSCGGAKHSASDQGNGPREVLGDLLYDERAKATISEGDWGALVQSMAAGGQRALHARYERAHRIVFTVIVRIAANRKPDEELALDVFHDV